VTRHDWSGTTRSFVVAAMHTLGIAACTSVPRVSLSRTCPDLPWSTPSTIVETTSVHRVARFASAVDWHGRLTVVGMDMPFFTTPLRDSLLFAYSGANNLGGPPGGPWFVFPRAVVGPKSSLTLIWAQPDDTVPARVAEPPIRLTSLWSSRFDPERRQWSPAQMALRGPKIWWAPKSGKALPSRDGLGVQTVAAVASRDSGGPRVVYLRQIDDVWTRHDVASVAAVHADLAQDTHDRLVVVFVAGVPRAANSVLVSTSIDGGTRWTQPLVVSREGAHDPIILIGRDDAIHLIWRQEPTNGGGADVLRHVKSDDFARTWSEPSDLHAAPGMLAFDAVIDRCNTVHVAYEDWHGGGNVGDVDYAKWNGSWTEPLHLMPGWVSADPVLMVDSSSNVHLVMLARPSSAPLMGALANVHLILHIN
jgi:hypothetical protein